MSALDDALDAAESLGKRSDFMTAARAAQVGSEIPNQMQAVSDAIAKLQNDLNDHATQSPETRELVRDASAGLANVLRLAKNMRGGR